MQKVKNVDIVVSMLADEVKRFFKGEVRDDPETLETYSKDASIFEIKPSVVVSPAGSEDIKALVKFVSERKAADPELSLTVRSGGTDMTGGPLSQSIVVDMAAHFTHIEEITPESAVVEPGVYYRDFDKETRRRDVFMPSYPASREIATVGGMVANNSGGEKTLAYGKVEHYVEEVRIVLSDGNEYVVKPLTKKELEIKMKLPTFEGELYKKLYELITNNLELITKAKPNVTKNSAGYYLWNVIGQQAGDPAKGADNNFVFDLCKLIVGSQGTLGIVTKIKFKLVPVKKISKLAVVFLRDLSHLGEIVVDVVKLGPESLESYDDRTLRLAIHFFRDIMKVLKPQHALTMLIGFFPELWHIMAHGMPKLVMLVEFTGDNEEELAAKVRHVAAVLKPFNVRVHIAKSIDEINEYWTIRRESFNLLRHKVQGKHTAPFIDDFSVRPELLPEFLPKLNGILARYDLIYTIAGHPGDGNFHIIPLMDLADANQRAIIPKLSDEVYNLVLQYKGTITSEHNDGLIRTPYLEKMYGPEIIKLFSEVKNIFDPQNIFNPGKKVNGSMAYALAHIKKS